MTRGGAHAMVQPDRGARPGLGPRVLAWASLAVLLAALAVTLFVDPIEGMLFAAGSLGLAALSAWSQVNPRR